MNARARQTQNVNSSKSQELDIVACQDFARSATLGAIKEGTEFRGLERASVVNDTRGVLSKAMIRSAVGGLMGLLATADEALVMPQKRENESS